jgi:dihydrofolate reductase
MGRVIASMSMSLDGFIAAPNDTREEPLGDGGQRLHDWLFDGQTERDVEVLDELVWNTGAVVMGRRSYDLCEGAGGWGDGGPLGQVPCFVLSHSVPERVAAPPALS